MKSTILLGLFLILHVLCCAQKVGYFNADTIRQTMPQYHQMSLSVEHLKAVYTVQLEALYNQYEKMQKKLQGLDYGWGKPDSVLVQEIEAVNNLQLCIQEYEDTINLSLNKAQASKLAVVNATLLGAVKEVALRQGYSYVFDIATNLFVDFGYPMDNLNEAILKKLENEDIAR